MILSAETLTVIHSAQTLVFASAAASVSTSSECLPILYDLMFSTWLQWGKIPDALGLVAIARWLKSWPLNVWLRAVCFEWRISLMLRVNIYSKGITAPKQQRVRRWPRAHQRPAGGLTPLTLNDYKSFTAAFSSAKPKWALKIIQRLGLAAARLTSLPKFQEPIILYTSGYGWTHTTGEVKRRCGRVFLTFYKKR